MQRNREDRLRRCKASFISMTADYDNHFQSILALTRLDPVKTEELP